MSQTRTTLSLAAAAAAFALSPSAFAADNPPSTGSKAIGAGDKVQCYGVNFCNSRCSTSSSACRNRRECGEPWMTTAKNCLDKGGSLLDPAKGNGKTAPAEKNS